MRKILSVLLSALLLAGALSACGNGTVSKSDKRSIVATIFPAYDWVNALLGENPAGMQLTMLLDKGVDLHSYQPTADDMIKISDCDLFIYVGGASDDWVDDALAEARNENMIVVNLLDVLGGAVKTEELVEGMEPEQEEDADDGPEYDEHVWLSLRNAETLCNYIAAQIASIDAENADAYAANAEAYIDALRVLDGRYTETVAQAPAHTLLFGDRFPFRYLTDDYGLTYYAAFAGCSAETEASFETIAFLAGKVDELGLKSVIALESSDHKIAETIIQNTQAKDAQIVLLDSMQSTTLADAKRGATYLSIMENNLEALTSALQ